MAVYFWVAAMGVIGLIAFSFFIYSLLRDIKLRKKLHYTVWRLIPNGVLFVLSIGAFSMMIYFFLNVKEQLIQFS